MIYRLTRSTGLLTALLLAFLSMPYSFVNAQTGNPTDIIISEVMFNAAIEFGNRGEWVEIYNSGTVAIDLNGWGIRDNNESETFTTSMCPGGSCQIPAGECWLIAVTIADLQNEFNQYTNPSGLLVDNSRTLSLGGKIGNGLANTADGVALLYTNGNAVDCVSWGSLTLCNGLTYYSGGNGQDTSLSGVGDAQSIANIQGQWYKHEPNASPYNCTNTAAGGSPTAVTVVDMSAEHPRARSDIMIASSLAALFVLGGTLLVRARRHHADDELL